MKIAPEDVLYIGRTSVAKKCAKCGAVIPPHTKAYTRRRSSAVYCSMSCSIDPPPTKKPKVAP